LPALLAGLLWIAALAWSPPAGAHPHVWIQSVTTFVFAGGQVTGIRFAWTFDELFSAFLIKEYDRNRDGAYGPDEIRLLEAGAFANLANYEYFAVIRQDGRKLPVPKVSGFTAEIRDGAVTYRFTVPLPAPVDPRAVALDAGVYDESYFVEFAIDEVDPVRFEAMVDGTCGFRIDRPRRDQTHGYLGGPERAALECGGRRR